MNKTLIIIDAQNDFITGALANPDAVAALPTLKKVVDWAIAADMQLIYTLDTHNADYLNTPEGRKLPILHCIEGTWGWKIADAVKPDGARTGTRSEGGQLTFIEKLTFGYRHWFDTLHEIDEEGNMWKPPEEIILVGFCSDICVMANAMELRTHVPEIPITIISDAIAGSTPEAHAAALTIFKSTQCDVMTWDEYCSMTA